MFIILIEEMYETLNEMKAGIHPICEKQINNVLIAEKLQVLCKKKKINNKIKVMGIDKILDRFY